MTHSPKIQQGIDATLSINIYIALAQALRVAERYCCGADLVDSRSAAEALSSEGYTFEPAPPHSTLYGGPRAGQQSATGAKKGGIFYQRCLGVHPVQCRVEQVGARLF